MDQNRRMSLGAMGGLALGSTLTGTGIAFAKDNPPAAAAEEQTEFTVVLADAGASKINVIKEVRTITGLGLIDAKKLVEEAPKPIKEGVNKEEANKIKEQLEKAGAKVEIK